MAAAAPIPNWHICRPDSNIVLLTNIKSYKYSKIYKFLQSANINNGVIDGSQINRSNNKIKESYVALRFTLNEDAYHAVDQINQASSVEELILKATLLHPPARGTTMSKNNISLNRLVLPNGPINSPYGLIVSGSQQFCKEELYELFSRYGTVASIVKDFEISPKFRESKEAVVKFVDAIGAEVCFNRLHEVAPQLSIHYL